MISLAGEGSFGKVYQCAGKDGTKVAIKEIDKQKLNEELFNKLKTEAKISMDMSHPNIIKCYNTMQSAKKFYLVFEYCSGGDLQKFLQTRQTLPLKDALSIMRQMRDAYKYLLQKNIIHRDIKLENILIGSSDTINIKLTDFGCSKIDPIGQTSCGTPKYMSLEIMDEKKQYNYKADLWAIGLCYWELIFGYTQFPFSLKSLDIMKQEIRKFSGDNLRFPTKPKLPDMFYQFFKSILSLSPDLRMDSETFLNHPIFNYDPDQPVDSSADGKAPRASAKEGGPGGEGEGKAGGSNMSTQVSSTGEELPKIVEAVTKTYNERFVEIKLTLETVNSLKVYFPDIKDNKFFSYYCGLCLILLNKAVIKADNAISSLTLKKNVLKVEGFDEFIKYPNQFNKFKEDFNEINEALKAADKEIYSELLNRCFSDEYMQEVKSNLYHHNSKDLQKFYKDTFGFVQNNYKTLFDQSAKNDLERQLKKAYYILKGKITESMDVFY